MTVPIRRLVLHAIAAACLLAGVGPVRAESYDVVIYGASSAGVIAAAQAARMGKSALLIAPTGHVGGMTASGLGCTDTGNAATIGGLAFAFYAGVYQYYQDGGQAVSAPAIAPGATSALTAAPSTALGVKFDFEPHAAEAVFLGLLRTTGAEWIAHEPLDRTAEIVRDGRQLRALRLKSGRVIEGRMFIDATYEGDLLAAAHVSHRLGRESRGEYGETLAGVHRDPEWRGEVDPYRAPGERASPLLPGVSPRDPGPDGTGDDRVQQFNLRLCLTKDPTNRVPFERPPTYDRANYELLRRRLLHNPRLPFLEVVKLGALPGGKADLNANGSFSTDMAGDDSTRWPVATDEERAAIMQRYRDYTAGLFWFLEHDPGVPITIRREAAQWGRAADEFADTDHWPWQLYVREARRMLGEYVITQHDCQGRIVVQDPVALGSYSMDSHKVTLFVDADGRLNTEGFFDVRVDPYPISYRAITPRAEECENLLVPICVSATHVAFNSIRMEPVYMMLGQSAATAACLALDTHTSVQGLDYSVLAQRLRADGQILTWPAPPPRAAEETTDEPDSIPPPRPRALRR